MVRWSKAASTPYEGSVPCHREPGVAISRRAAGRVGDCFVAVPKPPATRNDISDMSSRVKPGRALTPTLSRRERVRRALTARVRVTLPEKSVGEPHVIAKPARLREPGVAISPQACLRLW